MSRSEIEEPVNRSTATGNRQQATGNRQLQKGADIAERLLRLAASIVQLASALPDDATGRHVAHQWVRAATSAGANYDEARAAESRADFIHKLGIAAKELREACYWARLAEACNWIAVTAIHNAVEETSELAAILTASRRTARARQSHP